MFMRVDSRTRAESVTSNYDIVLPEEVKNEDVNFVTCIDTICL